MINGNAYTYDAAGMRTSETVTNGSPVTSLALNTVSYSYNNLNQLLTESPDKAYTYDADGNMTSWYNPDGRVVTAAYDAENRLKTAQYTDAQNVSHNYQFYYNADGFIARQVIDGVETRFIRDGYTCLQERDSGNAVTRSYAWDPTAPGGIGGLLEMTTGGQHYNYLYDGRGNVRALIDALIILPAGQDYVPAASYTYDSFGRLMSKSGTLDQPYMFSTKYYYLPLGMNDFGYRGYLALLVRWLTRDPMGEEGGLNLYLAMENDSINKIDPWGLWVIITVQRECETKIATPGRIMVQSDRTNKMFIGYTLERKAGTVKPYRIPAGDYNASKYHSPHLQRDVVLLNNVPSFTSVEIHNGSHVTDSTGCVLVGWARSADKNTISRSQAALSYIMDLINTDGSGIIDVIINDPVETDCCSK